MIQRVAEDDLDLIAGHLVNSERVLFITGAGLSADSGVPTYRGIGGLYGNANTEEGIPIEVALSGETLATRPALCWKYIHQIEQACRDHEYNRGHEVIAKFEEALPHVTVLTQNVDGFHRAAGSQNVIAIHGDIHQLQCTSCRYHTSVEDYSRLQIPPTCPECDGLVRPAVVLFGEMLPEPELSALRSELGRGFDIVFSVGTTSVFPYIIEPVMIARAAGNATVEINPDTTDISVHVKYKISGTAATTLDELWNRYRALTNRAS